MHIFGGANQDGLLGDHYVLDLGASTAAVDSASKRAVVESQPLTLRFSREAVVGQDGRNQMQCAYPALNGLRCGLETERAAVCTDFRFSPSY